MQLLYMLAVLVAMTLWSPVPAAACSCVMMPVEQSIAEHPVILSGRLTKMDLLDRGDMIRLEIAVEQGFKGTSSQTTGVVYSRPFAISCYGYNFRLGFQYLVFAKAPESPLEIRDVPVGGRLVGTCGGTVEADSMQGRQRLKTVRRRLESQ